MHGRADADRLITRAAETLAAPAGGLSDDVVNSRLAEARGYMGRATNHLAAELLRVDRQNNGSLTAGMAEEQGFRNVTRQVHDRYRTVQGLPLTHTAGAASLRSASEPPGRTVPPPPADVSRRNDTVPQPSLRSGTSPGPGGPGR